MKLTEKEKFTIACALRVAQGRYSSDATSARELASEQPGDDGKPAAGWTRIAEQFDKQVAECNALLDNQFENCL